MTKPTTGFEHPNPSIFVIIRGSTDSDDDVPRTISNSSLIYAKYFHKLNLYNLQIKFKTIKTNNAIVAYTQIINLPSGMSVLKPYFPIVNVIPPNAPTGANFITIDKMLKNTFDNLSKKSITGCPFFPNIVNPAPNKMEKNRTCKISPLANASNMLDGTICKKKSIHFISCPLCTYCETSPPFSFEGSNPSPGRTTFATMIPIIKAAVVTISKYNSAFPPTRPTFFILPILAIPSTIVKKIIGAITILIILMNVSPIGFICCPTLGQIAPTAIPQIMATITWNVKFFTILIFDTPLFLSFLPYYFNNC
ncbi:hypothetical protein BMB171_C3263 [Bacillus thuringiensis BMB171]|nr:hypothetical protein BMB171_C3263 [Bacillus thuringiensis BMB171]